MLCGVTRSWLNIYKISEAKYPVDHSFNISILKLSALKVSITAPVAWVKETQFSRKFWSCYEIQNLIKRMIQG